MVKKNKPKEKSSDKIGLGISGFTLGIISIAVAIVIPFLGIIFSVVGFSLSAAQQRKNPTKFGKRGIILNGIGFVFNILVWMVVIRFLIPIIQQRGLI